MSSLSLAKIKNAIKNNDKIYALWTYLLGMRHSHIITNEQRHYVRRAKRFGLKALPSYDLQRSLRSKLASRGIHIEESSSGIHTLYASHFGNWEMHQIPPALRRYGPLTLYSLPDRGFNHEADSWVRVRHRFDEDLLSFVRQIHEKNKIDVFIGYLNGLQISKSTIEGIGKLGIVTVTFNFDDRLLYRGRRQGRRWTGLPDLAGAYDLCLSNSFDSLIKYRVDGGLPMFWPPGASPDTYKPLGLPFSYDVSFIGSKYGARENYIEYLRQHDVNVITFGHGWPNGPVSEPSEMNRIYSQSKINLGFSWVAASRTEMCLKGRDFEVPMSGAVYLTTHQPDIEKVYNVGSEVVTYHNKKDLLDRIISLLHDPGLCESIRSAARRRAINEHTWEARFAELFRTIGMLG